MTVSSNDGRDLARARLKRPQMRERVYVEGEGYDVVVDAERCDRDYEDAEADRRRDAWTGSQDDRLAERRADRETMTLGARLDKVLVEVERGMGTRARPIEASRGGSEESPGGGRPAVAHAPELVGRALQLIVHHVETIERQLDEELGLLRREPKSGFFAQGGSTGGMAAGRLMSTEERDRIVFDDFQGVRSEQVAQEAPYLGTSARTIERARAAEARRRGLRVRQVDGVVLGEVDDGTIRRVKISGRRAA